MSTTNTNGRVRERVQDAPQPVHVVALSGCHTLADKIRYACEHTRPNPTTAIVRDWLTRYGIETRRPYVSTTVNAWRKENDLADTGDLPALSAEVLAELDADRERERVHNPSAYPHGRVQNTRVNAFVVAVGARGFYIAALLSLAVSFDTAWRFFGDVLGITNWERPVMFAVVEVGLIASAFGMRAGMIRDGHPGPARYIAWALCGAAGYMALVLSGPIEGLARVIVGPLFGLLFLHIALGIEVRARRGVSTGTWARIGRELRERFLSRLGLADDERDALARTRDRAGRRAARLALARFALFRGARLARAVARSGVAQDDTARVRMLAELAALRYAGALATLDQPSPWLVANDARATGGG